MRLNDPPSGPSGAVRRAWWWRRLPLTAQLAAIGMVVALAWFLTARLAADIVAAEVRSRAEQLDRLHLAEVAAVRMLGSLNGMSAAVRGFVVSGDEAHGVRYEAARRSFEADASVVADQVAQDLNVVRRLQRMRVQIALYDQEIASPNFEVRRRQGFNAFGPGTPGLARVERGANVIDALRTEHARMLRLVRENLTALEAEIETATARNEWESFLIRAAAVMVFLLALTLMMRLLSYALNQVVRAAEALDAGRYEDARLPNHHKAPNAEMARLALTFDRLAQSIAIRERQLQEDIEKLKELERLKADFVSTVSHELRTPLTSMRGALGLLLGGAGGELSPKGRELLRIALTNTDRLIRLINDILDIEKMDAGHVQIRRDRVRLRPLLETTIAGLDGLSRDTGVPLVLHEMEEVELIGDSDRLIQVFTNLISNAVKFSPKGEPVEVSATLEPEGVRIGVRDHGPGIAPEFQSRIFGRFQQAGGAASRQSGGTGLGLSIAKAITELHGGRIGFENVEDGGTRFGVVLPIAPEPESVEDRRPAVLVVEDDDSMREVLCTLFEPFAHAIAARDAAEAMRGLGRFPVKVVVVDHGLPGMDGLALARRLRADPRYRGLPVLLYSATEFGVKDLKDSGIRIGDAFVKTRDSEQSLLERVKRELQG
ncbi:MAG: response regulator [Gemmatimonadaceae bacterium]|nr:response regulator [Gemmatimonadaceae bacterium]MCW5826229.1 response regulator [Gemmatimonadaceae bacterium]